MIAHKPGSYNVKGTIVTHCTISNSGNKSNEPQTTIIWRCGDWGADYVIAFTPYPKQHMRTDDQTETRRII